MSAAADGPAHRARSRSMRPITRTTTPIVGVRQRGAGLPVGVVPAVAWAGHRSGV